MQLFLGSIVGVPVDCLVLGGGLADVAQALGDVGGGIGFGGPRLRVSQRRASDGGRGAAIGGDATFFVSQPCLGGGDPIPGLRIETWGTRPI